MYETQAVLKNVNLRTELSGEDRHGAFDLKFETMLTPELHARLCGKPDEKDQVTPSQLRKSGIGEVKYDTEIENVQVTFGKCVVKDAKLNKVAGAIGTDFKVVFRVQAQLHVRGLAEELNDMVGEPHHLVIEELQGDLLNQDKADHTQEVAPQNAAETRPRKGDDEIAAARKKAAAKKKRAAKKKAKPAEPETTGRTGIATEGQEQETLTDEQIQAREDEKRRILAQAGVSNDTRPSDDVSNLADQCEQMIEELNANGAGLLPEEMDDLSKFQKRLANGRQLSNFQMEKLSEMHHQYCR